MALNQQNTENLGKSNPSKYNYLRRDLEVSLQFLDDEVDRLKVTHLICAFYHQTAMCLRDKGQEGHDLDQCLQDILVTVATKITVKYTS